MTIVLKAEEQHLYEPPVPCGTWGNLEGFPWALPAAKGRAAPELWDQWSWEARNGVTDNKWK